MSELQGILHKIADFFVPLYYTDKCRLLDDFVTNNASFIWHKKVYHTARKSLHCCAAAFCIFTIRSKVKWKGGIEIQTKCNYFKKLLLNSIVVLSAVIIFTVMVGGYLNYIKSIEQERVDQIVRESAVQSVALIKERLYNDMTYIENIGRYLGWQEEPIYTKKVLQSIQNRDASQNMLRDITVATPDGNLYHSSGEIIGNIKAHSYFQEAMQGKSVISNIEKSVDDSKNMITIAAPIRKKNRIIGIVNGRFLMTELTEFLSADSFDGCGYSYMANADGTVFVMADHDDADPNFTSIYDGFKPIPSVSDEELERMLNDMRDGKEGRISYKWHGENRTMTYMPVGINDWYLLSVIPNEIVTSLAMKYLQQVFLLTGGVLVILLCLISYMNGVRKKNKKTLASMNDELLVIYNTIPGGIFKCVLDHSFTVTDANDGFYRSIGYSKEMFETQCNNQLVALMQSDDINRVKRSVAEQLKSGITTSDEVCFIGADGSKKWLLISGEIVSSDTEMDVMYCCFTDMSELKQTQENLRKAKQRYDLILAETEYIIFEWNPVDKTIFTSKMHQKKLGYAAPTEGFPQSMIDAGAIYSEDKKVFLDIFRRIENGDKFSTDEIRIRKADDSFIWCRVSATAVYNQENHLSSVVGIIEDIDLSKRNLEKITATAQKDALTKLYNKITTQHLIEQRLSIPVKFAAFLMIDIDNFKNINDTLGHSCGDAALVEVSHQLKSLFRTNSIVGRVGGDEFVVFLEGTEQRYQLQQKFSEIVTVFKHSLRKDTLECSISCSIGIALFPQDAQAFAGLFRKADEALYFVKRHGKNQYAFYDEIKTGHSNG